MKLVFVLIADLLFINNVTITQAPGWPRNHNGTSGTLIVAQPQVDHWQSFHSLAYHPAFTVTPVKGKEHVGVLCLRTQTIADMDRDSLP